MATAKKTTKKVASKKTKAKVLPKDFGVLKAEESKKYLLTVYMNDEVFECDTNNIAESISALKPLKFKTKVIIRVANDNSAFEKVLMIQKAKVLFRNKLAAQLFEKNALLLLK